MHEVGDEFQVEADGRILTLEIEEIQEFKYTKEKIYHMKAIVIGDDIERLKKHEK